MTDNAFRALAHEQRRTLLLALVESNARNVDGDASTGAPSDADRRVQTEMYHVHLPKLEDYGYIEWDEDTNDVTRGPKFDEIRPLLESIPSDGPE